MPCMLAALEALAPRLKRLSMRRHVVVCGLQLLALGLACAPCAGVAAASAAKEQPKAELAAVRARIAELVKQRAATLAERDATSARLRAADLDITARRRELDALQAAEVVLQRRRALLSGERAANAATLAREQALLAAQIEQAYRSGRRQELKILLSQTDPGRVGRMLAYEGYVGRQRAAALDAIREVRLRLSALDAEADRQAVRLGELQDDARHGLAALQRARDQQRAALADLAQRLGTKEQQLAALKVEEQSVESLLADLAHVLPGLPQGPREEFGSLQGSLPSPVGGRAAVHRQPLQNGVLIDAAPGAKVRAPYYGRVVYADWLPGLGLLLILSHTGGYLSLYGHAEVLYKAVGDAVAPGDVIAAMSDAPGADPKLYFEIRKGRQALDAKSWLQAAR